MRYEVLSYCKPTVYQVWDTKHDRVLCTCTVAGTAIKITNLLREKEKENK